MPCVKRIVTRHATPPATCTKKYVYIHILTKPEEFGVIMGKLIFDWGTIFSGLFAHRDKNLKYSIDILKLWRV